MILGGQLDFTRSFKHPGGLHFILAGRAFLALFAVTFVKSDSRFQNKENVVAGALDLANRLSDAVRVGERLVDRITQFLHQYFQAFFQDMPLSPEPDLPTHLSGCAPPRGSSTF